MTFDFQNYDYLRDWDNKSVYFERNTNGLTLRRTRTGNDNLFSAITLEAEAGTTITNATQSTDWDKGKWSIVTCSPGSGVQVTKID